MTASQRPVDAKVDAPSEPTPARASSTTPAALPPLEVGAKLMVEARPAASPLVAPSAPSEGTLMTELRDLGAADQSSRSSSLVQQTNASTGALTLPSAPGTSCARCSTWIAVTKRALKRCRCSATTPARPGARIFTDTCS